MRIKTLMLAVVVLLSGFATNAAKAQDVLDGDTGLACEALLCLAAPTRPGECLRSIRKYFSIDFSNPLRTIRARLNFLRLCPVTDAPNLADELNEIYGRCGTDGYQSDACAAFGWGQEIRGNCYELVGQRCNLFQEANAPDGIGTFGICEGLEDANVGGVDVGISACREFTPIDQGPIDPNDPIVDPQ